MECDIIFCHFGSFFPFYPTIECKKIPGDIILLNMSNIQEDHMMYGLWDKRRNVQSFLSFWAILCPLTLLTTQKIKIKKKQKKKQKKRLEILSFYTCVPQLMVICMVPDIWRVTDRIYYHFGPFFALYATNNPGNQNFEKMKKKQVQISSFNTSVP